MSTINGTLTNQESRQALLDDVLSELTSISFRDWLGALKRWQEGALSLVHMHVLMLLRSNGPLPMSRLADLLDVSVASATGIIDRIEKRGMVERRHSETDRRIVEVHLTDTAWTVFGAMDAGRRERMALLIGGMSDEELTALRTGLRAMRAARQRLSADAGPEPEARPA